MQVININYLNFRNLANSKLEFDSRYNLFLGKNGQGKTSVLEAIYFAVSGKSFRTKNNKEIINYNKNSTGSLINYRDKNSVKSIGVKLDNSKKEYKLNKKNVKYDEFLGRVNAISFIPDDINLILGSPSIRRSFFDYEISQGNEIYFNLLKDFDKVLKVRNRYLKEKKLKDPMYEIYTDKFISLAIKISKRRQEYIKKLSILLNLNYRKLFDINSELKLVYKGVVDNFAREESEIEKEFRQKLKELENNEKYRGHSLIGPQKDEYIFYLNNQDSKSYSSQGEKKSIIFSLKVAEIDMFIKEKGESPIFIIDDISSYFDSIRKESIINYFKNREVQLFISSTEDLGMESKNFHICKGEVNEL